jgi:hypothetical protein
MDKAMAEFTGDLTVSDVEALFYTHNQTMTTANKAAYTDLFRKLDKESGIKEDIAEEVLGTLFQQHVGELVANLGFDFVNGTQKSMEPLRRLVEDFKNDFTPNIRRSGSLTSLVYAER